MKPPPTIGNFRLLCDRLGISITYLRSRGGAMVGAFIAKGKTSAGISFVREDVVGAPEHLGQYRLFSASTNLEKYPVSVPHDVYRDSPLEVLQVFLEHVVEDRDAIVNPRTGQRYILKEDSTSEWASQPPTYLVDGIAVSEGPGTQEGSQFCFWIGHAHPESEQIRDAIQSFITDQDVASVRYVRAFPNSVHPSIATAYKAARSAHVTADSTAQDTEAAIDADPARLRMRG